MAKKATTPKPEKPKLNPKQEAFCRYYAQGEGTFGNATLSYAAAYDYDLDSEPEQDQDDEDEENGEEPFETGYDSARNVCAVEGARLLRNPNCQERINVLLNELLKDEVV